MGQMPGMDMGGMNMNMGPLMVMNGNDMGIRVGSSDTNIMSMGAMGSGTTWQPSSGPMHMYHKQSGDWLLMFHYNMVAGMNRQGGPTRRNQGRVGKLVHADGLSQTWQRHGSVARHVQF